MSLNFNSGSAPPIRLLSFTLYLIILLLLLPGCSGGGGPTSPDIQNPSADSSTAPLTGGKEAQSNSGNKALWGYWDISITKDNGLEIVPLRGIAYTLNVTEFLQPPMGSVSNIGIEIVDWEKLFIAGDVTVDVSLT